MRNTLYSRTLPLSPPLEQKRSRQCTGRCISCVCCGGGCSRCPVLLLPPGSCPDTLGGRSSPGFGTPRSLAVSGRHLGPVPLGRPPLQGWGGEGWQVIHAVIDVLNQQKYNSDFDFDTVAQYGWTVDCRRNKKKAVRGGIGTCRPFQSVSSFA